MTEIETTDTSLTLRRTVDAPRERVWRAFTDADELAAYRDALVTNDIPWTQFACEDVDAEYDRLRQEGVEFTQEPMTAGAVRMAVFDDTCGNLIQIVEHE